ncbi:MAG: hypothetical protein QM811_21935 [Pirellulales bacterium]
MTLNSRGGGSCSALLIGLGCVGAMLLPGCGSSAPPAEPAPAVQPARSRSTRC